MKSWYEIEKKKQDIERRGTYMFRSWFPPADALDRADVIQDVENLTLAQARDLMNEAVELGAKWRVMYGDGTIIKENI